MPTRAGLPGWNPGWDTNSNPAKPPDTRQLRRCTPPGQNNPTGATGPQTGRRGKNHPSPRPAPFRLVSRQGSHIRALFLPHPTQAELGSLEQSDPTPPPSEQCGRGGRERRPQGNTDSGQGGFPSPWGGCGHQDPSLGVGEGQQGNRGSSWTASPRSLSWSLKPLLSPSGEAAEAVLTRSRQEVGLRPHPHRPLSPQLWAKHPKSKAPPPTTRRKAACPRATGHPALSSIHKPHKYQLLRPPRPPTTALPHGRVLSFPSTSRAVKAVTKINTQGAAQGEPRAAGGTRDLKEKRPGEGRSGEARRPQPGGGEGKREVGAQLRHGPAAPAAPAAGRATTSTMAGAPRPGRRPAGAGAQAAHAGRPPATSLEPQERDAGPTGTRAPAPRGSQPGPPHGGSPPASCFSSSRSLA